MGKNRKKEIFGVKNVIKIKKWPKSKNKTKKG
jgi:hypothetical protein